MAWLEQAPSGIYHVAFRLGDEKFKKSTKSRNLKAAGARLHRVEENLRLVESGRLTIPERADPGTFLFSDGKLDGGGQRKKKQLRALGQLCDAFKESIPQALPPFDSQSRATGYCDGVWWSVVRAPCVSLGRWQRQD